MDRIKSTLADLGLSDKEITMYLALVKVGSAPASVLAKRTGMVKSTAQYTCKQLQKKGIATVAEKNDTYIYTPEPPEKLLLLLDRQRQEIGRKEQAVQEVMEQLRKMMNPHSILPRVQFFEGKESMIELYDKILDQRSPIDSFEDMGNMQEFIPEYCKEFVRKRIELRTWNRVICAHTNTVNPDAPEEFRSVRTLPVELFPFTGDMKICKDLVSIFSFDQNTAVGIAIRHQDIAQNFRILFEAFWNTLASR